MPSQEPGQGRDLAHRLREAVAEARRGGQEQPARREIWAAAEEAAVALLRAERPRQAARDALCGMLAGDRALREAVGLYLQFARDAQAEAEAVGGSGEQLSLAGLPAAGHGPVPGSPRQLDLFEAPGNAPATTTAGTALARAVGWQGDETAVVTVLHLLGGPHWPRAVRRAGLPRRLEDLDAAARARVGVLVMAL